MTTFTEDISLAYRNALFFVTGGFFYTAVSSPVTLLVIKLCPNPESSEPCNSILTGLAIFVVVALPLGFLQWYRTGKWIWTKVFHVFAEEAS